MKQKKLTIISVTMGAMAMLLVLFYMYSVQSEADSARNEVLARYGGEQVEVYVATRDILVGERVDSSSIERKKWVADLLPEKPILITESLVGKTATSSIYKGEVFTHGRFEEKKDMLDIPSGTQAVSVPVKTVEVVGGAIQPGMEVDVYLTGNTTTSNIGRNVKVLALSVGNSNNSKAQENGWITLALDSSRVQEIIAGAAKGSLYFVIPNNDKHEEKDKQ